jgi:hypothetical protein
LAESDNAGNPPRKHTNSAVRSSSDLNAFQGEFASVYPEILAHPASDFATQTDHVGEVASAH